MDGHHQCGQCRKRAAQGRGPGSPERSSNSVWQSDYLKLPFQQRNRSRTLPGSFQVRREMVTRDCSACERSDKKMYKNAHGNCFFRLDFCLGVGWGG